MAKLDRPFSEKALENLAQLTPETKPEWGEMNVPQLYGHLTAVVLYSTGQGPAMPFKGNAMTRHVFRHLVLYGIVPIPRGVKVPRPVGMKERPKPPEATLDDLREALEIWHEKKAKGALTGALHPFFGKLSAEEWSRFHAAHFKHHLTQFGVWN